jgi:high affinity choline transporter 7
MVAYWVGIFVRLSAGEDAFNLPALIKFPLYDHANNLQKFPFRTFSMLTSFSLIILVSWFTKFIFENEYLSKRFDIFQCVTNIPTDAIALNQSNTVDELTKINSFSVNNNRYDIGGGELENEISQHVLKSYNQHENQIDLHESTMK